MENSASSYTVSSNIFSRFPPREEDYPNRNTAITVLRFAFFYIFFFKRPSNTVLLQTFFHCFTLLCLTFLVYKYYAYHNYYVWHSTYEYAILSISSPVFSAEKGFLQRVFRYSAVALSFHATYIPLFFIPAFPQRKSGGKSPSLFHQGIFALISAVYLLALLFS